MARILQPLGSNRPILDEVVYDSLNLLDLDRDFACLRDGDLKVVNFFEERKTCLMKVGPFKWNEFVSQQGLIKGGRNLTESPVRPGTIKHLQRPALKCAEYWSASGSFWAEQVWLAQSRVQDDSREASGSAGASSTRLVLGAVQKGRELHITTSAVTLDDGETSGVGAT